MLCVRDKHIILKIMSSQFLHVVQGSPCHTIVLYFRKEFGKSCSNRIINGPRRVNRAAE
jgi:hypothetical protein